MTTRIIDYPQLVKNYDNMIETLEYDSMRSGGKAKLNADALFNMLALRDRYAAKIKAPIKKEVTKNG
jgi:hypothetical protein